MKLPAFFQKYQIEVRALRVNVIKKYLLHSDIFLQGTGIITLMHIAWAYFCDLYELANAFNISVTPKLH